MMRAFSLVAERAWPLGCGIWQRKRGDWQRKRCHRDRGGGPWRKRCHQDRGAAICASAAIRTGGALAQALPSGWASAAIRALVQAMA